ncbi:hypothetical protein L6452_22493 [Arctium lappa]|uniref:Uncharacterized protein n=1 Tax=Arctium lappa TaxID=4217 RepID=A0ACB9B0W2_ARCLA|nr:hypothetical protein L6452_22493 [Arctium lappa]
MCSLCERFSLCEDLVSCDHHGGSCDDLAITEEDDVGFEFANHGDDSVTMEYNLNFCYVLICNLPTCFFTETIGKDLADYIGTFTAYDDRNKKLSGRNIPPSLSVSGYPQTMKKEKKVKKSGGD